MNSKIENVRFLTDEEKIKLPEGALFDRIINVKINCYSEKSYYRESFVIRSDYELIYPDSNTPVDGTITTFGKGKCLIRPCTMKPSIKVQCKMVTGNTGTNVDVFISNFFMLTKDGKHLRSFNSSTYKIESVEIVMGYRSQFKSMPSSPEDYYNLKAENGADKITIVSPIVVQTDKLPPDSVLHIHGYVAGIYSSPVAVTGVDNAEKAKKNPVISSSDSISEILYRGITRRYLNMHKAPVDTAKVIPVSDIAYYDINVDYDKDTGLLSLKDAETYGVRCYLTDKVKEIAVSQAKDSDGNPVNKSMVFEQGWTIGHTLARLSSFLNAKLEYTFNNEGDMLIYTTDEVNNPDSIYTAFVKQKVYDTTVLNKFYDNKLPAVYNINIDAVATIVCPFFTFIQPFQKLEFASRYALTSVTSYFAGYSPAIYAFQAINASISFATVDSVNEVHITAVALKE